MSGVAAGAGPGAAYRVTAIHAGHGPESGSASLAARLLDAVREGSPVPVVAHLVGVWDLLPAIHDALRGPAWDLLWDPRLCKAQATVRAADGIIAVTPIIHGAYSGPFKSFVDLMGTVALAGKPVLIAACGGSARHSLALDHVVRPLFVCLRCTVLPTAVFATTDECRPDRITPGIDGRSDRRIDRRIDRAARELVAAATRFEPVPLGPDLAVRGA